NSFVIPCGVDMELFKPIKQSEAKNELGLKPDKKYILFSSNFDNVVKNYPLAQAAVSLINNKNLELIALKGFSRIQVSYLMNAVDMVLMTSFSEGSPQFIKEAMACNVPIVSTNVGDVQDVIGNTDGCYITSFEHEDVSKKIGQALKFGNNTIGRTSIKHLKSNEIAMKIIEVYKSVLNPCQLLNQK
ncbi:MAG: glycosyltransferase, partial [Melioribacteraceae bacterium]|nr:glycosyltransferase [Melioribacteraceae bacterium]